MKTKVRYGLLITYLITHMVIAQEQPEAHLAYDGTLIPGKLIEIVSPAKATIHARYFNYGDKVTKDQRLVDLTSPALEEAWLQAKQARLENQQALTKLKNWSNSREMLQAKSNVNKTHRQAEIANQRFVQTQKLYQAGIISKEECLMDERFQIESAETYHHAKDMLAELIQKGNKTALQLAQVKYQQSDQKVKLLAQKRQALAMIAKEEGVILPPQRPNGETQQKNVYQEGEVLATIADLGQLAVLIKVDEYDVVHLKNGMKTKVILAAFPNSRLEGNIQEIYAQTDSKQESHWAARFNVKIALDPIPNEIRDKILLGLSARVEVCLA